MADRNLFRFVKLLAGGAHARKVDGAFVVETQTGRCKLATAKVHQLAACGLVNLDAGACHARPEACAWLKRQMADADNHAAQHRNLVLGTGDTSVNLNESRLAKLSTATNGRTAYLAPHHLLAGERIRGLFERAHLIQRTTMSYDPSRLPGSGGGVRGGPVNDMAMDARKSLALVEAALPADCAGVVLDVCGYLKGLQQVETERRWPRRSAKLVLRIGLEQAAAHFGLSPVAAGPESRRVHNWLGEGARPTSYV